MIEAFSIEQVRDALTELVTSTHASDEISVAVRSHELVDCTVSPGKPIPIVTLGPFMRWRRLADASKARFDGAIELMDDEFNRAEADLGAWLRRVLGERCVDVTVHRHEPFGPNRILHVTLLAACAPTFSYDHDKKAFRLNQAWLIVLPGVPAKEAAAARVPADLSLRSPAGMTYGVRCAPGGDVGTFDYFEEGERWTVYANPIGQNLGMTNSMLNDLRLAWIREGKPTRMG